MRILVGAAALAMLATGAQAEVAWKGEGGFRLENRVTVSATPERAYAALGEIGGWWDSGHSYSGKAANMTLELKPGGCFCEALPGGGVQHGTVVAAWPAQGLLRLEAPLGPLQAEGVAAVLTFEVKPAPGGAEIVQTYNVGGARPEIVGAAAGIDAVVGEQLRRLKAYLEVG